MAQISQQDQQLPVEEATEPRLVVHSVSFCQFFFFKLNRELTSDRRVHHDAADQLDVQQLSGIHHEEHLLHG